MSDTSQGEGWWLASDGKWYPPSSAPGAGGDPAGNPTVPHQVPQPVYGRPASERVVIQAPMSLTGAAGRLWKPVKGTDNTAAKVALGAVMVCLIAVAWMVIVGWYVFFGILVIPYRLIRRGSRKRKREELRHRETLAAINRQ